MIDKINLIMTVIFNIALVGFIPFAYYWVFKATRLYIETKKNEIQKLEQERYNLAQIGNKLFYKNCEIMTSKGDK